MLNEEPHMRAMREAFEAMGEAYNLGYKGLPLPKRLAVLEGAEDIWANGRKEAELAHLEDEEIEQCIEDEEIAYHDSPGILD